jgi:misacylated tRNA(Ala) deacylase
MQGRDSTVREIAMPTSLLFRDDAYLKTTPANVLAITDRGGIVLDRTVFYATGGGQPGDVGTLKRADGSLIPIATAVWNDVAKTEIAHVAAEGSALPVAGEAVTLDLDWPVRHARMRVHTALHLLSVALPYPVTGGSIGDGEGRLDFDIPDAGLDRDEITAKVMAMVATDAAVTERWITDAELDANPSLVKTMSVQPPRGSGRVRLVEIAGLDLQPCGGTHVRSTGEIGAVSVTQIEKKGKQNRRVRIALG